MRVLGIDPGYDRVGWAVVDRVPGKETLIACGLIQTRKTQAIEERLSDIFTQTQAVIREHTPTRAVIEELFFAANVTTGMNVAQARGVIVLCCQQEGLVLAEQTPMQIKQAVTGNGRADKKAVEKMVRLILNNVPDKLIDDTLDAIAAAMSA